MKQVTKTIFLEYYEKNLLYDIVSTNNRVYAKTVVTQDKPQETIYFVQ